MALYYAPITSQKKSLNDYQKIYSDWYHEFEKYNKLTMKSWQRKHEQWTKFRWFFCPVWSLTLYENSKRSVKR
ncbi:hypothetical protein Phum_PHUM588810 [Pediculus humanus corporis]|uniref:Uncharacterized protein n=1 Tax=Pediculus humanus subsp. corporis TaxID=121224 RepID=E0W2B8_PEDHC|nr:uncharacterized protein Phum_PHUM588810 [Pediculus humanus corporis]EEB19774.1 hypothetical protein Phum_PHUM588810 [Pediculus humanus corporis]